MAKANDTTNRSCPSCGARVPEGAEACDLCGTPLDAAPEVPPEHPPASEASAPEVPGAPAGAYCNACGWKNPPGARFCSQCGARLQEEDAAPSATRTEEALAAPPHAPAAADESPREAPIAAEGGGVGRQVAILVGAGLLLVVALFLINVVSKEASAPPAAVAGAEGAPGDAEGTVVAGLSADEILSRIETPDVPAEVAERAAELRAEIERLDATAGAARQRELVDLYLSAGLLGRAAAAQRTAAETQGSFDAWRRAGNLLYDWMETIQGGARTDVAALTVEAYQRALAINPDDVDVRTDLATAYLNTSAPMQGVTEIQQVLEADPDHVQANFNYGYMLLLINRLDQAEQQFVRVQELVGPDTPFHARAEELLQVIRDERAAGETAPDA